MKPYLVSAAIALVAVTAALALFFAGFFVRGWVDQEQVLTLPTPTTVVRANPAPTLVAQTTPTATPTTAPAPTAQAASPTPTATVPPPPTATPAPQPTSPTPAITSPSVDGHPSRGPENATVTIVEFSDFQCSFCKRYVDQTLPQILSTYGDRIRYVFRNLPIASIHPHAQKAAEAALCAFEQDRFWEYHDHLFEHQAALDVPSLKAYARDLHLDGATFDACLDSGKYAEEVRQDFADAISYGVTGAPTFFINGRKLVGAQPFAAFQKIIEEELAKASGG